MQEFQRWYDKKPCVKEVFIVLKNMQENELDNCSRILYGVIIEQKRNNKNSSELSSVGYEKLKGYYKSFQKRRWYDKNPNMRDSARYLSLMKPDEAEEIIKEFMLSMKARGLDSIYENNKTDL